MDWYRMAVPSGSIVLSSGLAVVVVVVVVMLLAGLLAWSVVLLANACAGDDQSQNRSH